MSAETPHTRRATLPADPVELFNTWYRRASDAPEVQYPSAMCLSTVSPDGRPQGRFVIAHPQPDGSFVFLTDRRSPKARSLAALPVAALTVYWDRPLELQIRVEGPIAEVSAEVADGIFARRPRASQMTHSVSRQSEPVTLSRLVERIERLGAELGEDAAPGRPPHWVGYRLTPERFEFWEARARRLHDRFLYTREDEIGWSLARLSP